jgi:AraC family transcriptional regulator
VVQLRQVNGFDLIETRYAPGYGGGEHRHPKPYFGWVVEGDFVERTRRGESQYARGSLHFHPSDDLHTGVVGDRGARCFNIMPGDRLSARLDSATGNAHSDQASPLLASLASRCHRGYLARDSASDLECEGAALELVATVLRMRTPSESSAPGWLHVARDYLHANGGRNVSLAELSAISNVHPVYLARVFRHVLGVTPAGYVRRIRLEQACSALATTDLPLVEVALAAGYSSQSHLTRAFSQYLGSTPAAYRRARRRFPA